MTIINNCKTPLAAAIGKTPAALGQTAPGLAAPFACALFVCAACFAAFWLSGPALAHGDLQMEGRECRLKAGPFQFRLTGYQTATGPGREFCEDIPRTGKTVMVFESTGLPVDAMTIDIRLIRDSGQAPEEDVNAPMVAMKIGAAPRGGGVSVEHEFSERGRYVGLFTVRGGNREYTARFPFTVGAVKAAQFMQFALEAALLTAVLVIVSKFARLPRKARRRKAVRRK